MMSNESSKLTEFSKRNEISKLLEEIKETLLYLEELDVEELKMPFEEMLTKSQEEKQHQWQALSKSQENLKKVKFSPAGAINELLKPSESEQKENQPITKFQKPSIFEETSISSFEKFLEKKDEKENPEIIGENAPQKAEIKETETTEKKRTNLLEVPQMAKKKQENLTASLFDEIPSQSLPVTNETLEDIRKDIGNCKRCPLYQDRTQIVHSTGNPRAKLMFVGEAPGVDEDAKGEPFVGKAGQLLTKIIEAMRFKREDVFIGNINRCRPPGNRAPTPEEAAICKEFLIREICVVRPKVIVLLGNTACQNLLDKKTSITKIRGEFQDFYGIKVMPTFHPAYLLRDPSKKREVWEDMKKVMNYLNNSE
jgi:uracil-DNA glycosylase